MWVVYFVSPVIIVPNFAMEKYRPRLALVDTFCYVRKAEEHRGHNVTGIRNCFSLEHHLGYY